MALVPIKKYMADFMFSMHLYACSGCSISGQRNFKQGAGCGNGDGWRTAKP